MRKQKTVEDLSMGSSNGKKHKKSSRYLPLSKAALIGDWETAKTNFFNKDEGTHFSMGISDGKKHKDSSRYLPLYKAALDGDWDTAKKDFFDKDEEAITAIISRSRETALHKAVSSRKAIFFFGKLMELMPRAALAQQSSRGFTALHKAAIAGNKEAAIALVNKNPDLLYILSKKNKLPVQLAAIHCKKDTLEYLISKSKPDVENSPSRGRLGFDLLLHTISSEFFDVALDLARNYPDLAGLSPNLGRLSQDLDGLSSEVARNPSHLSSLSGICALSRLAERETAFFSNESFSWWQNLIYRRIPVKQTVSKAAPATPPADSDIGSASDAVSIIWNVIEHLVPQVKDIREKKEKHAQALELVKHLCGQMVSLPQDEAMLFFGSSIMVAASYGISEIVEEILGVYPPSYFFVDGNNTDIFQLAASNRF